MYDKQAKCLFQSELGEKIYSVFLFIATTLDDETKF